MNVEGILRAKGATVATIRPDATIGDLVHGLREERIGAMVVSEDGRAVLGIISERDVVRGLAELGPRILEGTSRRADEPRRRLVYADTTPSSRSWPR